MTVRVLVVDDERLVHAGYRMILQGPRLDPGEAAGGLEAIHAVRNLRPDVVLVNIRMPRPDGIEATRRITRLPEPPAILIVTTFDDEYVYRALCGPAPEGPSSRTRQRTKCLLRSEACARGSPLQPLHHSPADPDLRTHRPLTGLRPHRHDRS
jgi:DNA-binding NarL/FixJ family response regulator